MRPDIPREPTQRHKGNEVNPVADGTRAPHSREEFRADPHHGRRPVEHKRIEATREVPRELGRPGAATDPRRPVREAEDIVGLELRPEEKALLRETGRFRVVRTADLREMLYGGKACALESDVKYLRGEGLIETEQVNLRRHGRRRTIERVQVVTLTEEGRRLLMKDGDLPKDQKIYAGLVKPREVEHDSQIYRAYQKEVMRIERIGGTNFRVRLDFEIKGDVQKAIHAERKADPKRDMAEIKQRVAERFKLPFSDGRIQIPDARIDYDLPGGNDRDLRLRTGHQDIEVLTAAYHAGHLRWKAQAGFRNYASVSDRSSLSAKVENASQIMENIFDL